MGQDGNRPNGGQERPSGKYRFGPRARTDGYTQLPNAVLYDDSLSAPARLLYAMIWDLATFTQDEPEQDELAAKMACGSKTLRGYVSELTKAGLVKSIRRGRGLTNAYEIHEPLNGKNDRSRSVKTTDASLLEDELQDAGVEDKSSTPGRRRPVFDAIAEATNANVGMSGGEIAKAEKAIRSAEAESIKQQIALALAAQPELDEIPKERIDSYLVAKVHARASRYAEMRPDLELTPSALAKHWLRIPNWQPRSDGRALSPSELANLDLG